MHETANPRSIAAQIAGFGLVPDRDAIEVPSSMWETVRATIEVENLTGLASAAEAAAALALDDEQGAELNESYVTATTWTLGLERALTLIQEQAREEGIEAVVLKGPALAHCFYPDPAWRPFKDLDVLVRTADWRRACAMLERLGFRRELPEPHVSFDERFGKAAVHVDERGLRVDLHRTLVLGPFAIWLDPEALFERTVSFELAGRGAQRLDDTTTLLHACMHASLGWYPPLLQPLRDVVQVATEGQIDWERFEHEARRWRLRAVVRHSLEAAQRSLGVDVPVRARAMVSVFQGTRRERRALAGYTTARRSRGGIARSTFWAVRGVRSKVALLRHLLLPDRRFLAARAGEERPSYLRRLAIPVRWFLRRSG